MKKSKDTPLNEITLRRYEKASSRNKRELARKICLSMGVLQPGDSRDVIVDLLLVLLEANIPIDSKEVEKRVKKSRKKHKRPMHGVASSNIRRQLRRLREVFLAEKIHNKYRITENLKMTEIWDEKIEWMLLEPIKLRIKEYLEKADEVFNRQ